MKTLIILAMSLAFLSVPARADRLGDVFAQLGVDVGVDAGGIGVGGGVDAGGGGVDAGAGVDAPDVDADVDVDASPDGIGGELGVDVGGTPSTSATETPGGGIIDEAGVNSAIDRLVERDPAAIEKLIEECLKVLAAPSRYDADVVLVCAIAENRLNFRH